MTFGGYGGYYWAGFKADVRAFWREVCVPNPALEGGNAIRTASLRFAKAVATFAFQSGMRQAERTARTARTPPPIKPDTQSGCSSRPPRLGESGSGGVAVVIPTLVTDAGRLRKLCAAVECVRAQSLPPTALFVVDDGSPVRLEGLTETPFPQLQILRSPENEGPAAARNRGLEAARNAGMDFVCFTDSDCLPEPDWVQNIFEFFRDNPSVDLIGGITTASSSHLVDDFHDAFGTLNGRMCHDGSLLYIPTCNMGVRLRTVCVDFTSAFREAGFEDIDFCFNARSSGATLRLVREARVIHEYSSSLRGLFKQFRRYGRSSYLMDRLHPDYQGWLLSSDFVPSRMRL